MSKVGGGEDVSEYGGVGSPVEDGDTASPLWVPTLLGAWVSLTLRFAHRHGEVGGQVDPPRLTLGWGFPAILYKQREQREGVCSRGTVWIDRQKPN